MSVRTAPNSPFFEQRRKCPDATISDDGYVYLPSDSECLKTGLTPPPKPLPRGVGYHLRQLLSDLGATSCADCIAFADEMDRRGVQWCIDNKALIIERLKQSASERGWAERLKVSAKAAARGLLSYSALVDEAIRLASPAPIAPLRASGADSPPL